MQSSVLLLLAVIVSSYLFYLRVLCVLRVYALIWLFLFESFMSPRSLAAILLLISSATAIGAEPGARFVQKIAVKPGLLAVVAEGDMEARSIGSYTVRTYSNPEGKPANDTTFYSAGLIRIRDGTIESVALARVDKTSSPALVVVIRSAGTGGYLSADAFAITGSKVVFRGAVKGLPPDADPVAALRRALSGKSKK